MVDLSSAPIEADAIIALGALVAGLVGALVGLGGGILVVPLLTVFLGVDVKQAMGASLLGVIATSTAAGALRGTDPNCNHRVGILLETTATIGAIAGALLAAVLHPAWLLISFGSVLILSALLSFRGARDPRPGELQPDRLAQQLRLDGADYLVQRPVAGVATMLGAGILSGLLGIGSGVLKVTAMDTLMRMPFRASTITSNFMIGITGAAGLGIYWHHGLIEPRIAGPTLAGVVPGAMLGAWLVRRVSVRLLRMVFLVVLLVVAGQMIYSGLHLERSTP